MGFFYKSQAKAFQTVGYGGTSQYLGLGLPMTRFWYQSMVSITLYDSLGGALSRVIGMTVWLLSMLVWLSSNSVSAGAVFITLVAAVLSSNFYGNCFDRQNYNVFGWALLPIVFWGLVTGNIWLSLIFTGLIAVLSVTVFAFVCILVLTFFFVTKEAYVFLTLLPGFFFYPIKIKGVYGPGVGKASGEGFFEAVAKILEFVSGFRDPVLRRPTRWLAAIALTACFIIFPGAVYISKVTFAGIDNAGLTIIAMIPVVVVFVNQSRLFRFADLQSVMMFFMTVSSGLTLICNHPLVYLVFYFSNTNGIISLLLFGNDRVTASNPFAAPPVAPISTAHVQQEVQNFLSPVPAGSRVLCIFQDPQGNYNNLFIGQYPLNEVLYYAGQMTGKPVFPDAYLAMSREAEFQWGMESIERNLDKFSTDYFVVTEGSMFPKDCSNYTRLSVLKWREFMAGHGGVATLPNPLPEWHLMRRINVHQD